MTVCIGLLTCDRPEQTERTLASFREHNDPSDFTLLHADDASSVMANFDEAWDAGFATCHAPTTRLGQMAGVRALVEEANRLGCEFFVLQENDWPWLEPFPWAEMQLLHGFDTLRLYGARKELGDGPRRLAGTRCLAQDKPIDWRPVYGGERMPCLEWAYAHWVPLSVTRVKVLLPLVRGCASVKAMHKAQALASLRVKRNIVIHGCEETTAGFMP